MMKKVIGVITARMASRRLPGKVMKEIAGKSIFAHNVERMKLVRGISGIYLATSEDPQNASLIDEAKRLGCGWYAGSEQDIVDRHIKICEKENADAVIRVTSDCPIFDFESATRFIDEFQKDPTLDFIYVTNMTMITGTLSELISYRALKKVHEIYRGAAVSLPIKENPEKFKMCGITIHPDLCRPEYRLTLDEPLDYELINKIYSVLYKDKPLDLHEVYGWLDDNPAIAKINNRVVLKGCNVQNANLSDSPVFSIVKSAKGFVIYDEHKRVIEKDEFLKKFHKLFSTKNLND